MPRLKTSNYLILAFSVLIALLSVRLLGRETKGKTDKPAPSPSLAKSDKGLPTDNSPSKQIADVALAQEIDHLLDSGDTRQPRWGVFVMSLKDGRVLYSRDGDKPFTPASNMKVYTTAVALDLLGPDYRWRTSVYALKQPDANGVINGDLTLYGRGAPDLVSKPKGDAPSLAKLADQLYQSGVREVRGDVVGDASYFRSELFGMGWQWNDLQWYFGAEPSALSIDENSVEVTMSPATRKGESANVIITPNQNFVRLTNDATTGEHDAITTIGILRAYQTTRFTSGAIFLLAGGLFGILSVHDPSLWAATLFTQALTARGIKVSGQTRSRDFRTANTDKFDPQKAVELAYENSELLAEIVRRTNKESNNLFAELILRTIGKERGTTAPDPDPRKNAARGDDEAGTAVVRAWLESKGIATRSVAIRDGSGLSRLDLVTPETTARLLSAMTASNAASQFHDSLPNAGHDGTLAARLKNLTGRIFAKTCTLTYTHSLSGYAATPRDEVLVFSIMCNEAVADRGAVAIIDQIATSIAGFGRTQQAK
jgi:D-alanyl-D-alanine carboxypeptidase/D-alanyl-D-alanine-endopeptidase (penicillin-binding protein 4)